MCRWDTVSEDAMFHNVKLYLANEISQIFFEENKTYLVMIAQESRAEKVVTENRISNIYTVVVPAIIFGAKLYHDALLVCELKQETTVAYCTCNKESEQETYKEILSESQSILLFVHWLDSKIYQYLDKIFSHTNEDVSIMGAGCGRNQMESSVVMTHNGVELMDGFLVFFSQNKLSIGTKHGVSFYDGYYVSYTKDANKIVTINGEGAFSFYAKMVKKYFNEEVDKNNIFEIGLKYPFGLGATRGEKPIRVPVGVENDCIIVAGPMDEENTISLMHTSSEGLLGASFTAVLEAKMPIQDFEDKACFMIVCMGRQGVLGALFPQELENIVSNLSPSMPCYGVLSLGEIANSSDKYIEYSNQACVVGIFSCN